MSVFCQAVLCLLLALPAVGQSWAGRQKMAAGKNACPTGSGGL